MNIQGRYSAEGSLRSSRRVVAHMGGLQYTYYHKCLKCLWCFKLCEGLLKVNLGHPVWRDYKQDRRRHSGTECNFITVYKCKSLLQVWFGLNDREKEKKKHSSLLCLKKMENCFYLDFLIKENYELNVVLLLYLLNCFTKPSYAHFFPLIP